MLGLAEERRINRQQTSIRIVKKPKKDAKRVIPVGLEHAKSAALQRFLYCRYPVRIRKLKLQGNLRKNRFYCAKVGRKNLTGLEFIQTEAAGKNYPNCIRSIKQAKWNCHKCGQSSICKVVDELCFPDDAQKLKARIRTDRISSWIAVGWYQTVTYRLQKSKQCAWMVKRLL